MAFRRRRFYRRFRRRNFRNRKVTIPVKKYVKSQLAKNIEYKYRTLIFGTQPVVVAGNVYPLTNIPQGLLDTNRIGDVIKLKALTFRCEMIGHSLFNYIRMIIFQWKSLNALPPAVTAVLNGISPTYLTQPKVDNRPNYQILYDRTFKMDPDNPSIVLNSKARLKYAKRDLIFNAGSATQGTNLIYLLLISDGIGSTNPDFKGEFNFWYTDS